eukprot:344505-Hanusia_phi.AAC.2
MAPGQVIALGGGRGSGDRGWVGWTNAGYGRVTGYESCQLEGRHRTMGASNTKASEEAVAGSNGRSRRGLKSGRILGQHERELLPAESDDQHSWILDCDLGCCARTKSQSKSRIDWLAKLGRSVVSVTSSDEQTGKRRHSFGGQATPGARRGFTSYRRLSEIDLAAAAVHENKNTGPKCKLTFSPKGLLTSKQGFVHFNGKSITDPSRQKHAMASTRHGLW